MSDFSSRDESGESFAKAAVPTPGQVPRNQSPTPGLISSALAPTNGRVSAAWAGSNDQAELQTEEASVPMATAAVELTALESRVVGSLIEKSYLTPDVYPMTTNGLVTACNQKTNRDPVVDYSAVLIDSALLDLRQRNLVRRVYAPGSRSTKHRQTLDEALALNERQLALVSVLLLRGPQTVGELRLRTERHDVGFDDLDTVDACLLALSERVNPVVVELPRRPGHKENRWQHLLGIGEPEDLNGHVVASEGSAVIAEASFATAPTSSHGYAMDGTRAPGTATGSAEPEIRLDVLEAQVAMLQRQLASLAEKLGEPLEQI
jgi:uncharacterized protein YceH (UPF0502 family)